jgi:outer membrane immunogenic protein
VNFDVYTQAAPPNVFDQHRFNDQSRKTGGLAGGQIGYNWQTGMTVLGIEADAQWVGNRVTSDTILDPFFHGKGHAKFSSNVEWLATVRGRAGIAATPSLLLYVTGGVAFAGINMRYQNAGFGAPILFSTPLINTYSATDTRVGWTAGFGAEFAVGGNWSVKAEYLRVGFDDHSYSVPFIGPQPTPLAGTVRVNQDIDILRAGVNYKFGGPIVAKY